MAEEILWLPAWPQVATPFRRACVWVGRTDGVTFRPAALEPTTQDHADTARRGPAERPRFLFRRLALRQFIAAVTGMPPAAVAVVNAPGGQPRVVAPSGPWQVSTSHREGWLALALARHPVGVDIELADDPAPPAWNVLAAEERRTLAACPPDRQGEAFLLLWTAKEAYLKATGLGLSRETTEIAVRANGMAPTIVDSGHRVRGWTLTRVIGEAPHHRLRAAVVTLDKAVT